ncbi:MAG: glycosyl hydrolase [Myxococcales bacterium]|nr:glycosyl hydrolase [Myxococcales bacterium]
MLKAAGVVSAIVLALGCSDGEDSSGIDDDLFSPAVFADPPLEFGPQARWWWPGGAVDDATLREELSQVAELGYSAVEIQPFMSAVTNADLSNDSRIRTVGDASFLERLRTAACTAQELGLSWDLTLGSGWSTGGVGIDQDGARQLILAELTISGPRSYEGPLPEAEPPTWIDATNSILPAIAGFDENATVVSVLAAEVLEEPESSPVILGDVVDLGSSVAGNMLSWEVPEGTHRVFAIYENRTLHFPVGNAYPGPLEAARIIDHLDRRGVEAFIDREFGAWIDAVADCSPRAVFVDSFELVGELPWTTAFGAKFESTLGYDITPMLPFLFLAGGESEYATLAGAGPPRYQATAQRGLRAREDYEAFRGALFVEELIDPLGAWLQDRGIEFRLQAHGGYADVLDAYGMADVPESEGLYGGGSYDFLRLAASAA